MADGRLYTLTAVDDVEYLVCLDAESGETNWKLASGTTYEDRQSGDGPRSTPTVVGDVVYGLGAEGELLSVDKNSGEVHWRRNILNDFHAKNLRWGVSTSPYRDGDRLLVNVGGERASIVGFKRQTGDVAWQTGKQMWSDRSVGKGSLVAAQGHLFVLGELGDLAVIEATPDEYREKGRFKALESTRAWTPPAFSNGKLYIRDLVNAVCIDICAP